MNLRIKTSFLASFLSVLLKNPFRIHKNIETIPWLKNFELNGTLLNDKIHKNKIMMLETNKKIENNHILEVSTFRRKKTKLKREKRNQRRKKLRNLSWKKKEHKNY